MSKLSDLSWAAGFLEGEGYFASVKRRKRHFPVVTAGQVDILPLLRLQRLVGGRVTGPYQNKQLNHRPHYQWSVFGREATGIMLSLFSLLSKRRQDAITEAISVWKAQPNL